MRAITWADLSGRHPPSNLPSSPWVGTVRQAAGRAAADDLGVHLVASVVLTRAAVEHAAEVERRCVEEERRRREMMTGPGVDQPWYGIGFVPACVRFWKKYAVFSGRASRGEYWWAILAISPVLISFYAVFVVDVSDSGSMAVIAAMYPVLLVDVSAYTGSIIGAAAAVPLFVFLLPVLAVTWRRLRDAGGSEGIIIFTVLFGLVPVIGQGTLIWMLCVEAPDGGQYRFDGE